MSTGGFSYQDNITGSVRGAPTTLLATHVPRVPCVRFWPFGLCKLVGLGGLRGTEGVTPSGLVSLVADGSDGVAPAGLYS